MHSDTGWVNYADLPVNCPHATRAANYQRGGQMAGTQCPFSTGKSMSGVGDVNYGPNTKGGPEEAPQYKEPPLRIDGDADRYDHRATADDYTQAGNLYRLMPDAEKQRLAETIVSTLSQVSQPVRDRMLKHFEACDPDYAARIRSLLV